MVHHNTQSTSVRWSSQQQCTKEFVINFGALWQHPRSSWRWCKVLSERTGWFFFVLGILSLAEHWTGCTSYFAVLFFWSGAPRAPKLLFTGRNFPPHTSPHTLRSPRHPCTHLSPHRCAIGIKWLFANNSTIFKPEHLPGIDFMDLLHVDIQGAEDKLFTDPRVAQVLRKHVARIILGTHSELIHSKLVLWRGRLMGWVRVGPGGSLVAIFGKTDLKPQIENVGHHAIMLHDLSYHSGAVSRTLHRPIAGSTNDISKQEDSFLEETTRLVDLRCSTFWEGKTWISPYRNSFWSTKGGHLIVWPYP